MKHSRLFLFLTFISLVGLSTFLNAQFTGKQSDWKGFKKTVFKVGEYEAFVVQPKEPAKDKPGSGVQGSRAITLRLMRCF